MNLAARVDSGDSRPASSVAPRCTVFLAGEGKACRMRCSMRLNSASRASSSVFFFSASLVAAAAASVSSLYLRSSSSSLCKEDEEEEPLLLRHGDGERDEERLLVLFGLLEVWCRASSTKATSAKEPFPPWDPNLPEL